MDIKGTSFIDCYDLFFFFPYDVLQLMDFNCYMLIVVFLFFMMMIHTLAYWTLLFRIYCLDLYVGWLTMLLDFVIFQWICRCAQQSKKGMLASFDDSLALLVARILFFQSHYLLGPGMFWMACYFYKTVGCFSLLLKPLVYIWLSIFS